MQIKKINVNELLRTHNELAIPFYQRNYVWEEKDVRQLLKDIMSDGSNEYYLGSIFLLHENSSWKIIDGQQRLTTLWLITKVLNLFYENSLSKENYSEISNNLQYFKIKTPYLRDGKEFNNLIECDSQSKILLLENKNTQYYLNFIEIKNFLITYDMRLDEFFIKFNNVVFAEIIIDKKIDEHILFSKINSTGKRLSGFDLIKNYLFSKILIELEMNKQEFLLEDKLKLFSNYVENNFNNENGDEMLRHFIAYKTKKICNNNPTSIYETFLILCDDYEKDYLNLFDEILNFSIFYFFVKYQFDKTNNKFNKILIFLNHSFKTYAVLVIDVFMKNTKIENWKIIFSENDINNIFNSLLIIETYKIRREFLEFSEKTITRFIPKLVFDIGIFFDDDNFKNFKYAEILYYLLFVRANDTTTNKNLPMYRGPNIDEFKSNFINRKIYNSPKFCKLFLIRIASNNSRGEVDFSSFTIEHILPQNISKWEKNGYKEDPTEVLEKKDTIGNLTLTAYNSEYSNDLFSNKITKMKEKENFNLNNYFYNIETWNLEEISKRSECLFEKTLEIWNTHDFDNKIRANKNKFDSVNIMGHTILNEDSLIMSHISSFRKIKSDLIFDNIKRMISDYVIDGKSFTNIEKDVYKMNFKGWISKGILDVIKCSQDKKKINKEDFENYVISKRDSITNLIDLFNDIL